MIESLQSIFDQLGLDMGLDRPWQPVSRPALVGWLIFYAGFLIYALHANGGMLFIDLANLVVHEGGHNLFGWFGPTLGLWGGTLIQWLVPILLAAYFFTQRQTTGFVFSLFFFFENWLYTATYMADARAQVLPLVTTGDPEFAEQNEYTRAAVIHEVEFPVPIHIFGQNLAAKQRRGIRIDRTLECTISISFEERETAACCNDNIRHSIPVEIVEYCVRLT